MLKLVKEIEDQIVPYDEAVIQGKKIISEIGSKQWELGDLANKTQPKYGEQTLKKFAFDIGIVYQTLLEYRTTSRAWPENYARAKFSVCRRLNHLPDRAEILQNNPDITQIEAARLARDRRKSTLEAAEDTFVYPRQEPCEDCNTAVEQWQRSLGNILGDIVSMQKYWDHLFNPEWRQYPISTALLKLAAEAQKEFKDLISGLKEHPHDTEN